MRNLRSRGYVRFLDTRQLCPACDEQTGDAVSASHDALFVAASGSYGLVYLQVLAGICFGLCGILFQTASAGCLGKTHKG